MTALIPPLVFDTSALVALFAGVPQMEDLLEAAHGGESTVILPAAAMADAEAQVRAGKNGWEAILRTDNLYPMDLSTGTAVEIGAQPGTLAARHAAHEAFEAGATIVTRDRAAYDGLLVRLLVV